MFSITDAHLFSCHTFLSVPAVTIYGQPVSDKCIICSSVSLVIALVNTHVQSFHNVLQSCVGLIFEN